MATWTVSANNDAAMTAYIAMRLAVDHITVTQDQALAEMLLMAGINQAAHVSGPSVKIHGNRFAP
jgi:uncharacterized protein YaiI (UPF0178 family)